MGLIGLEPKIEYRSMQRAINYVALLDVVGSTKEIEKLRCAYNEQRAKTPGFGVAHDVTVLLVAANQLVTL